MSHEHPAADCGEILLAPACALTPPAQVALEDYARVLTRALAAATLNGDDETMVTGVHLCGLPAPINDAAQQDIVAFAREISARESSGGLGWS